MSGHAPTDGVFGQTNAAATISLVSAFFAAVFIALAFKTWALTLLVAIPLVLVAGLSGVMGIGRARRAGVGMIPALVGLCLGLLEIPGTLVVFIVVMNLVKRGLPD